METQIYVIRFKSNICKISLFLVNISTVYFFDEMGPCYFGQSCIIYASRSKNIVQHLKKPVVLTNNKTILSLVN